MTRFENVGVFIWEKVWLENSQKEGDRVGAGPDPPLHCHPSSYWLRLFEPNFFPYKYSNILKPSHPSYLSAYEDGIDRVFRNVGI